MIAFLIVVAALVGLVVGSELAVRGAIGLARRFGLSPMVIGLTVLSIGTSLPEISTNVAAGFKLTRGVDAAGIAVGNIVGSCLSQVTLLLGLTAVLGTLQCTRAGFWRDGGMVMAAALAMWVVCADGTATRIEGGVLVGAYASYVAWAVWQGRPTDRLVTDEVHEAPQSAWRALLYVVVGLAIVIVAAERLVEHGAEFARTLGIGEELIGLWVGVGTGMPELVVAVRALRVDGGAMSLGNLLGSNITDPMLSFGSGLLVHPMDVAPIVLAVDFPAWLLVTGVALVLLRHRLQLGRRKGIVLLACFAAFMVARSVGAPA